MTNPELLAVGCWGVKYRQEMAALLEGNTCPGCVADNDRDLCSDLSKHGCYDHEERELIWLTAVE